MFDIDIKTLFFVFTLSNIIIIPFLYLSVVFIKIKNTNFNIFIISRILTVVGLVLMVFRGVFYDFLSIGVANVFLIFGIAIETYCVAYLDKNFQIKTFKKVITFCVAAGVVFLFFYSSVEYLRIVIYNCITFIIYLFGVYLLLLKPTETKFQKIIGWIILGAAVFTFLRLFGAAYEAENSSIFYNSTIQTTSYIYLLLLTFMQPFLMLLIIKELDNVKLKELNESKVKFFSIISHDLKGPLGSLQQIGEILSSGDEMKEEDKKIFTDIVYKKSKQSYALVDNLLKWAGANSGKIIYNPELINLKKIVDNNISLLETSNYYKKITIKNHLSENTTVFADKNMTDTIVRNLISNALKFTHNLGVIDILEKEETKKSKKLFTFMVKDNGVGMDKKTLSSIFKPDSITSFLGTNKETGSGLGLKLCEEFVLLNKGNIVVESEEKKGTCVYISLPKIKKK